ncbi:MAG: PDZ domain-containing protein [Planctomycetota bacterium]
MTNTIRRAALLGAALVLAPAAALATPQQQSSGLYLKRKPAAQKQGAAPEAPSAAKPLPAQERGYLGVYVGEASDGGVTIQSIIDGGAAARVGLRKGDVIVAAEELPVRANADLMEVLSTKKPGDIVTFEIERGDA